MFFNCHQHRGGRLHLLTPRVSNLRPRSQSSEAHYPDVPLTLLNNGNQATSACPPFRLLPNSEFLKLMFLLRIFPRCTTSKCCFPSLRFDVHSGHYSGPAIHKADLETHLRQQMVGGTPRHLPNCIHCFSSHLPDWKEDRAKEGATLPPTTPPLLHTQLSHLASHLPGNWKSRALPIIR